MKKHVWNDKGRCMHIDHYCVASSIKRKWFVDRWIWGILLGYIVVIAGLIYVWRNLQIGSLILSSGSVLLSLASYGLEKYQDDRWDGQYKRSRNNGDPERPTGSRLVPPDLPPVRTKRS